MGMIPALSCPSCKKRTDGNHDHTDDDDDDEWLCCVACAWICMRYCGCCRPERLKKRLLEDMEDLKRQQKEEEEKAEAEKEEK